MNEAKVKDLKAGDNIEVIELRAKNVSQGKIGKSGTPYQHIWLTDGTGDIRFSLFGEDVNKILEGQTVKVISGYVKEYPVGSGKLQLALGKDGGNWQVVSPQGTVTKSDDIVASSVQIVNSDARESHFAKQTSLQVVGQLWQGAGNAIGIDYLLTIAQQMYEWIMAEEPLATKPLEPESEESVDESPKVLSGTGPKATKVKLLASAAFKETSGWTGPPTMDLVQKFAAVMNGILGGDKERHTWLKWTYGVESSKEVTGAKLQAVLDILKPTYADKKWTPTNEEAVESIKAMFRQALKDAGQTEMPLEQSVEEVYG